MSDDTLVLTRHFKASPERVFAAFTEKPLMQAWYGPETHTVPHCDIDARVGGKYRIELHSPAGGGPHRHRRISRDRRARTAGLHLGLAEGRRAQPGDARHADVTRARRRHRSDARTNRLPHPRGSRRPRPGLDVEPQRARNDARREAQAADRGADDSRRLSFVLRARGAHRLRGKGHRLCARDDAPAFAGDSRAQSVRQDADLSLRRPRALRDQRDPALSRRDLRRPRPDAERARRAGEGRTMDQRDQLLRLSRLGARLCPAVHLPERPRRQAEPRGDRGRAAANPQGFRRARCGAWPARFPRRRRAEPARHPHGADGRLCRRDARGQGDARLVSQSAPRQRKIRRARRATSRQASRRKRRDGCRKRRHRHDRPSSRDAPSVARGAQAIAPRGEGVHETARRARRQAARPALGSRRQALPLRRAGRRGDVRATSSARAASSSSSTSCSRRNGSGRARAARSGPTASAASCRISNSATRASSAVSRAPRAKLVARAKLAGYAFPWYSSGQATSITTSASRSAPRTSPPARRPTITRRIR